MKEKQYHYKLLIGIIIGVLLSGTFVYGATTYASNMVYYNNSTSTLLSSDVQNAIDELSAKYNSISDCPSGYACIKAKNTLALGDYVSLTPTKSSYTTDTSKTGYTSTQTINPQELNLWRVISLNADGTVDVISEHVSSVHIVFTGQTGYQNLVGYLNVLASQYENDAYTIGSRYFGYNGQTEYITDTSMFKNPAPWTCSTGGSCNPVESQGGGDTLYNSDYNLVGAALKTKEATNPSGDRNSYWIAGRLYSYSSSTSYWWRGYYVTSSGSFSNLSLYYYYSYSSSLFREESYSSALRPILTLKSGLKYFGVGSELYPMKITG